MFLEKKFNKLAAEIEKINAHIVAMEDHSFLNADRINRKDFAVYRELMEKQAALRAELFEINTKLNQKKSIRNLFKV